MAKSVWGETEEEELEEEFPETDISEDILKSSWVLEQGPIHDQPLNVVIEEGGYTKEEVFRTGIKYLPLGMRSALKRVKKMTKSSFQTVEMHTSKHGLMIALHDPRIKKLLSLYDQKLKEAAVGTGDSEKDKDAIRAVEEREINLDFANPQKIETSIVFFKDMEGPFGSFVDALGMNRPKVYCYLCLLSMRTIRLGQAIENLLDEEIRHFWNKVETRLKRLS